MRALPLSLFLVACSSLPSPTPPSQGAYGYVRQDQEDSQKPVVSQGVVALNANAMASLTIPAGAPAAGTDENGNYTIELPLGEFTICLVDADTNTSGQCDCTITVTAGAQIERLYLRETATGDDVSAWTGTWSGGNHASSCILTM